jgi:hypothetical protein
LRDTLATIFYQEIEMKLIQWNFLRGDGSLGASLVPSKIDRLVNSATLGALPVSFVQRGPILQHQWFSHPMVLAVPEKGPPVVNGEPDLPFAQGGVCVLVIWNAPQGASQEHAMSHLDGELEALAMFGELLSIFGEVAGDLQLNPTALSTDAGQNACIVQLGQPDSLQWTPWVDALLLFGAACEMLTVGRGFRLAGCRLSIGPDIRYQFDGSLYGRLVDRVNS